MFNSLKLLITINKTTNFYYQLIEKINIEFTISRMLLRMIKVSTMWGMI